MKFPKFRIFESIIEMFEKLKIYVFSLEMSFLISIFLDWKCMKISEILTKIIKGNIRRRKFHFINLVRIFENLWIFENSRKISEYFFSNFLEVSGETVEHEMCISFFFK